MAITPLVKINNFYLKREDLNPTGSAKDRSLQLQIQNLRRQGFTTAVISSTGNAAISAAYFCRQSGTKLVVFVSPKINLQKLQLLQRQKVDIRQSTKPVSHAFKFAKANHAYFLRQSTDPIALDGYSIIGQEIKNQLPDVSSIFIPVGSGTTLLGISQALPTIPLYAAQPAAHAPISSVFETNFTPETNTITDALGAKYLPLKDKVIAAIKSSHGTGLVIQNKQAVSAQKYLTDHNIVTSAEGALALAAFFKAQKLPLPTGNFPVILLTGAQR